jgi:hypothetical protein
MQNKMRYLLILTIFILSTFFQYAIGQLNETKCFSSKKGSCTQTIILDSAGYFFKERSCGEASDISFGRYNKEQEHRIRFQFLPFDSLAPFYRIVSERIIMEYDAMVTVTFYDRFKIPIANNSGVRVVDANNKAYEMRTDEHGQIEVNRFIYKRIFLASLHSIYGASAGIDLGREALSVYLNIPGLFLDNTRIKLEEPKALDLLLKKDGLYEPKSRMASYKLE